ncbi:hypothetical protein Tco_0428619 [Tanacetum coccineum]
MPLYGDGDLITIKFIQAVVECSLLPTITGNRRSLWKAMSTVMSCRCSQASNDRCGDVRDPRAFISMFFSLHNTRTHIDGVTLSLGPSAYDNSQNPFPTLSCSSGVRIGGGFGKLAPSVASISFGFIVSGVYLSFPRPPPDRGSCCCDCYSGHWIVSWTRPVTFDAICPVCRTTCLDCFEEHAVHCKELSNFSTDTIWLGTFFLTYVGVPRSPPRKMHLL